MDFERTEFRPVLDTWLKLKEKDPARAECAMYFILGFMTKELKG